MTTEQTELCGKMGQLASDDRLDGWLYRCVLPKGHKSLCKRSKEDDVPTIPEDAKVEVAYVVPSALNLGELKAALAAPKLAGVMDAPMDDSREVVVQVPVGEHPLFGTIYEYYKCRAAGVLFVSGRFVITIAAGERIGGKTKGDIMSEPEPKLTEYFQAIGVPIHSLNEPGAASIFAPKPEGTGVTTYDEATSLGTKELAAGRWRSFRVEKFYKLQ